MVSQMSFMFYKISAFKIKRTFWKTTIEFIQERSDCSLWVLLKDLYHLGQHQLFVHIGFTLNLGLTTIRHCISQKVFLFKLTFLSSFWYHDFLRKYVKQFYKDSCTTSWVCSKPLPLDKCLRVMSNAHHFRFLSSLRQPPLPIQDTSYLHVIYLICMIVYCLYCFNCARTIISYWIESISPFISYRFCSRPYWLFLITFVPAITVSALLTSEWVCSKIVLWDLDLSLKV